MMASVAHTVKSFDEELAALERLILQMAGMAETNLSQSVEALMKRDADSAAKLIVADERVDQYERDVEASVFRLLALRQPMANDLRYVFGTVKMAGSLERVGDYSKNIAKRTLVLAEHPKITPPADIARLSDLVCERLKDAIDAFANRDAEKAATVWARDQQVDDFYARIMRGIISEMIGDPESIECCAHFLLIGKNLERVGDHATNIAEVIEFQLSGKWRTDGRPKSETLFEADLA
jgi:phosphate transport system protein